MAQGPLPVASPTKTQITENRPPANGKALTSSASTLIKSGAGTISSVVVSKAQSGASMTVYDGIDNTGTVLGIVDLNNFGQWTPPAPVTFNTGLFVVTTGLTTGSVSFFYN